MTGWDGNGSPTDEFPKSAGVEKVLFEVKPAPVSVSVGPLLRPENSAADNVSSLKAWLDKIDRPSEEGGGR